MNFTPTMRCFLTWRPFLLINSKGASNRCLVQTLQQVIGLLALSDDVKSETLVALRRELVTAEQLLTCVTAEVSHRGAKREEGWVVLGGREEGRLVLLLPPSLASSQALSSLSRSLYLQGRFTLLLSLSLAREWQRPAARESVCAYWTKRGYSVKERETGKMVRIIDLSGGSKEGTAGGKE